MIIRQMTRDDAIRVGYEVDIDGCHWWGRVAERNGVVMAIGGIRWFDHVCDPAGEPIVKADLGVFSPAIRRMKMRLGLEVYYFLRDCPADRLIVECDDRIEGAQRLLRKLKFRPSREISNDGYQIWWWWRDQWRSPPSR